MVEFARSLMLDPKLVLLDEPSLGLDPKSLTVIDEGGRHHARQRKAVLHGRAETFAFGLRMATSGIVMERAGACLLTGAASSVLSNPEIADLSYFGGACTHQPQHRPDQLPKGINMSAQL